MFRGGERQALGDVPAAVPGGGGAEQGALQPDPVVAPLRHKQARSPASTPFCAARAWERVGTASSLSFNLLSFLEINMRLQNNPKRKVLFFFCLESSERDSGTRRTGVLSCLVCPPRHPRGRPGVSVLGEQKCDTLSSVPGMRPGVRGPDRCRTSCQGVQRRRSRSWRTRSER